MTFDDDTSVTDDEWQFGDLPPVEPAEGGGGLLREILDEVNVLRAGAEADRLALADALSASFAKIQVELEVLHGQVTSLRTDVDASGEIVSSALAELADKVKALDASGESVTSALAELVDVVKSDSGADVPAAVERVVAAHAAANVDAIVGAMGPQLTALRKALPTADTARIAMELSRLRHSLIGPDQPRSQ